MIITRARLSRAAGTQGSLAKVLLAGAGADRGHGLVWSLFSETDERHRRFLWREIEPGAFVIVADRPPEDPHRLWQIDSPKVYDPNLAVGDRLGFLLRANPTVAVRREGRHSTRADVVMHAKHKLPPGERSLDAARIQELVLDWLAARGAATGAEFDTSRCEVSGYRQVVLPRSPASQTASPRPPPRARTPEPISFSEVDISGVLTVTEPQKLRTALFEGVGRARAYGCGLLLVRRARGSAARHRDGAGEEDDE